MRIVPLAPKYCIKKPPIAGPISLDVLKLTAVSATSEGTWDSSISLGARDIRIGWVAEAIIPINKQINSNDFIVRKSVKMRKNNVEEHKIIALYDKKKANLIFALSIRTPKIGPLKIVGTRLRKAAIPTYNGELVISQASQPIIILWIHRPLRAIKLPNKYNLKFGEFNAVRFMYAKDI